MLNNFSHGFGFAGDGEATRRAPSRDLAGLVVVDDDDGPTLSLLVFKGDCDALRGAGAEVELEDVGLLLTSCGAGLRGA